MLIGELVAAVGVTSQTIRFFERKGFLPTTERGANGYRVDGESMLARLRFISAAQNAGLILSQIRCISDLRDDGPVSCAHGVTLIDSKLADVRARRMELVALQAELERLLERGRQLDPADCAADAICHILPSPKQTAQEMPYWTDARTTHCARTGPTCIEAYGALPGCGPSGPSNNAFNPFPVRALR